MSNSAKTGVPTDCCFIGNCAQRVKQDRFTRRVCDEHAGYIDRDVLRLKGPQGQPRDLRFLATQLDLGTSVLGNMLDLPVGPSGHHMSGQRIAEAGINPPDFNRKEVLV